MNQETERSLPFIFCARCGEKLELTAQFCYRCGQAVSNPQQVNQGVITVSSEKKGIGLLLGAGIFFAPYIFSWFTLQKRYSSTAKTISLLWAGVFIYICFLTALYTSSSYEISRASSTNVQPAPNPDGSTITPKTIAVSMTDAEHLVAAKRIIDGDKAISIDDLKLARGHLNSISNKSTKEKKEAQRLLRQVNQLEVEISWSAKTFWYNLGL